MGFLKFLKRKPKEHELGSDELDLPPAPPPMEDLSSEHIEPELHFEEDKTLPGLDETVTADLDFSKLPEMPSFQEDIQTAPVAPPPVFEAKSPAQLKTLPVPFKTPLPLLREPKPLTHNAEQKGRYPRKRYVKLDKFREAISNIHSICSNAKGINMTLKKFNDIRAAKENCLNSLSVTIHDIKKRMVYIDKKLTNGGG